MTYEAFVSQRKGTFFTVETILMPRLPFIADNIGSFSKSSDRVVTSSTLLCNKGLVTIHTVEEIFYSGKTLSCKLLFACGAHKAFTMPGLILVSNSSRRNGIFAFHTVLGKFLLMTVDTKDFFSFWKEVAGAYSLLALTTDKAFLMPGIALVFNTLASW